MQTATKNLWMAAKSQLELIRRTVVHMGKRVTGIVLMACAQIFGRVNNLITAETMVATAAAASWTLTVVVHWRRLASTAASLDRAHQAPVAVRSIC